MLFYKKQKVRLIFALIISASIIACKKDKDDDVKPDESFDKEGMLTNLGQNIIIPSYLAFKNKVDSLEICSNAFIAAPNVSSLNILRINFISAYTLYQSISTFEFGPAENEVIRANFNTFPCDTIEINNNISSGVYDLSLVSNIDAKGFPALDFLLFRLNHSDSAIVTIFQNSANIKNYLSALVSELKAKTNILNTAWSSAGGNYISSFVANTGSSVGGSIGMLVNQLNFDFELLKNARIGIPLGKKTLGTPLPEKVEAYYSEASLALLLEQLNSIENIYLGRDKQNIDGLGLDDYINHVGAQHSNGSLNDVIKNKFVSAKNKLALISGTLSQAVVNNANVVDVAYMELQQLVVLLKVDMPSALGVLITYQDNDGD